jgi:hypothetical protein
MGVVLMQGGKPVCYHFELFNGGFYKTYDKELYAMVQYVKKWKHYLMGKETLSTLITSHRNICRPKVSFNKLDTTSGWGFCSNFIYSSNIRKASLISSYKFYEGHPQSKLQPWELL